MWPYVLNVEGADVRGMPLKDRRAILDRVVMRDRMQKAEIFFGCGKSLFRAVCDLDLEGIIAKRLEDPYDAERTKWWKILNPTYSQKEGRSELFERRGSNMVEGLTRYDIQVRAAPVLQDQLQSESGDFEGAFQAATRRRAEALIVVVPEYCCCIDTRLRTSQRRTGLS
jgi:hypothetical protein